MSKDSEQWRSPQDFLSDYLQAFAARDTKGVVSRFAGAAVLELPMIRPTRLVGLTEIEAAHSLTFQNLSKASVDVDEVLTTGNQAIASGRLTIVCRGKEATHSFALASECTAAGLTRASWYLDSRGHRPWSDRAVL